MGRTRFGLLDTIESIPLETKKRIIYKEAKKKNDSDGNKDDDKVEDSLIQTTYNDLKQLRDEGKLVPGALYRITDYNCTTIQEGTRSAGHQFDIIVQALSENILSEDAKAIEHEGDNYFSNSNLAAWKLKYCLDNDDSRFAWAQKEIHQIYINYSNENEDSDDEYMEIVDIFIRTDEKINIDNKEYYIWIAKDDTSYRFLSEEYDIHLNSNIILQELVFDTNTVRQEETIQVVQEWLNSSYTKLQDDGQGVIYQMIDEYNNDCPYDFKNIQFLRSYTDFFDGDYSYWAEPIFGFVPDNDMYFYTFNYFNETINEDYSVIQQNINDENDHLVYDNHIKKYIKNNGQQSLNNIIIVSSSEFYADNYNNSRSIYGNKFGLNCFNITIGSNCICNNFGDFVNNSIFFLIYNTIVGNNCRLKCIDVVIDSCKFDNNIKFELSNLDGDTFNLINILYHVSLSTHSLYIEETYENMICFYNESNSEVIYKSIQDAFILS